VVTPGQRIHVCVCARPCREFSTFILTLIYIKVVGDQDETGWKCRKREEETNAYKISVAKPQR
jgi:hypothetical protein